MCGKPPVICNGASGEFSFIPILPFARLTRCAFPLVAALSATVPLPYNNVPFAPPISAEPH